MNAIDEIKALEERLIQAELGPEPKVFEELLADDAVLDGKKLKAYVVAAHESGKGPKFTKVEMNDFTYTPHGDNVVVVTCFGTYESDKWSGSLRFMRVWLKREGRWQIIAGSTGPATS